MLQFHFTDKQFYLLKSLPIFTERHEIDLVEYAVSMMKKTIFCSTKWSNLFVKSNTLLTPLPT